MASESEIGYGKPPKESQFKKGQSGNPRGRPKGSKNLNTLIKRELESRITIEQNGTKRKIRRKEALVKGLVNDALKGKDRPRDKVFDLVEQSLFQPICSVAIPPLRSSRPAMAMIWRRNSPTIPDQ